MARPTPQDWIETGDNAAPAPMATARRDATIQFCLAALLLIGYLVLGWRGREPTDIGGSDELEYIALSHSIEQGSYREIYLADHPRAVKYPPAFPAWIALVRQVAGDRVDAVLAANLVFIAGSLLLLFIAARQLLGGWLAVAFLALCVINPWVLETGGNKMSEAPFLFFTTAALFLAWKAPPGAIGRIGAVVALALLAFLTRSAGLTIVVAIGVWLLPRRAPRELALYAVACALIVGGWMGYASLVKDRDVSQTYVRDLAGSDAAADPTGAVKRIATRSFNGAKTLATRTFMWTLAVPTIEGTAIDNAAWLGAISLLLLVGVFLLWHRWRALAAFLVLYGGLLVAWPYTQDRLVGVVVPLIFLTMLLAARALADRLPRRVGLAAISTFVVLLGFGNVQRGFARDAERQQCDRALPYLSAPCYDVPERARGARTLYTAGEFIRTHSNPDDVVVASKPASVYFLTGRRTLSARNAQPIPDSSLVTSLRARNVRFVLVTFYFEGEDGGVARGLLPDCGAVRIEANLLPDALVLSLPDSAAASPNACAALGEFLKVMPAQ
ncbi:MAG TPA: hypothetical protein VJR92_04065 [Gemmatimonadaceae bacterium]|nr:hypothetical protein [Gemmatimonadaceae bacterium]